MGPQVQRFHSCFGQQWDNPDAHTRNVRRFAGAASVRDTKPRAQLAGDVQGPLENIGVAELVDHRKGLGMPRDMPRLPGDPLVRHLGCRIKGRVLGSWSSCRHFVALGSGLGLVGTRVVETVKTRKTRGEKGKRWARYGLNSVKEEGTGGITWS